MVDTNICIYLTSGRYPGLDRRVRQVSTKLAMSSIVLGELLFGIEKSEWRGHNRKALDLLLRQFDIFDFDADAAQHYAEIRAHLEKAGTPCGANDMLIGAHARALGMTLVTNNRREFGRMPGLTVESWV
jgi:tRNA(fMet)-specific endonuclease VapC